VVYKHATEFGHDRYNFAWRVAGDYLCYLNLTLTLTLTVPLPYPNPNPSPNQATTFAT
jgi:hypothetical protein